VTLPSGTQVRSQFLTSTCARLPSSTLRRVPASLPVRPGPMHSEGRIISKPFSPLLLEDSFSFQVSLDCHTLRVNFRIFSFIPLCISDFYIRCYRTLPYYWECTSSVCIMHLYSVFAHLPTLILPAYFCFLFLRAPLCVVYLKGYIFGGLSIWRAISIWRDPGSFLPPSLFLPRCSFLSFSEDSMISLTNTTSCLKNWRN